MPVLPLVGSTMRVSGVMRPWASAASIMATPMRSLTLPRGFMDSSLAAMAAGRPRAMVFSRTRGVEPTACMMSGSIPVISFS